jgi:hypothetical protein
LRLRVSLSKLFFVIRLSPVDAKRLLPVDFTPIAAPSSAKENAMRLMTILALPATLAACGGGDPDETINPPNCAALACK